MRNSLRAIVLPILPFVLYPGHAVSGPITELFFSEYVEGTSFNKALEIYNGTGSAIDLGTGNYSLELYSNGNASPNAVLNLSGNVSNNDVFVLANPGAALPITPDALSGSVINWNGDDAIVLKKAGTIIDSFGQVGVDPGSQWLGGGQNDTLRRKSSVTMGDTNSVDAFDASMEWDVFSVNTFDGLGDHSVDAPATVTVAFDLVGGTDQNLLSFTATPDNSGNNGAFGTSDFDVFGITDRTVNFDFADDSAGSFPADSFGIVGSGDNAPFFGIEDLDNADNQGGGGTAMWEFDIAGATGLTLAIDFAAMGDFEAGDNSHTLSYQIDGGPVIDIFAIDADESSAFDYMLENGSISTLNDPLVLEILASGVTATLFNEFNTYSADIMGTGNVLKLILSSGPNNGGGEVFAFRNIVLQSPGGIGQIPEPATVALIGLGIAGVGWSRRQRGR